MENALYSLSLILPVTSLFILSLILIVNLYLKFRRQYPIKANCWFCNEWTYVDYDNQNSFECSKCMQYNGFTSEGDYNKPIPAQYDEMLNTHVSSSRNQSKPATNGLCHICNNNQQLKIYQLANFVPMREENYDLEIEHFQKQLEKAYNLCSTCDNVVKKTIQKQNCLLGLNFAKLRKQGLNLLDLNHPYNVEVNEKKRSFILKAISVLIFVFAALNLFNSYENIQKKYQLDSLNKFFYLQDAFDTSKQFLTESLYTFAIYLKINELLSTFYTLISSIGCALNQQAIFHEFLQLVEVLATPLVQAGSFYANLLVITLQNPKLLNATAVIMELILLKWGSNKTKDIFQCFLWVVLTISRCTDFGVDLDILQISGSCLLIGAMLTPKHLLQRRLPKKQEEPIRSSTPKAQIPSFDPLETHSWSDPCENYNGKLNDSLTSFDKSDTVSFVTNSTHDTKNDSDLHHDLKKLNLGSFDKSFLNSNNSIKRPRPVLSPTRLQNVTQKSWGAGGFWRTSDGILMPVDGLSQSSRSSSQSSGIGDKYYCPSPPPASGLCCDHTCQYSEPFFYSAPMNRSFNISPPHYMSHNYLLQSNGLNNHYFMMQRNVRYPENLWNKSNYEYAPSLTQSWVNSQKK